MLRRKLLPWDLSHIALNVYTEPVELIAEGRYSIIIMDMTDLLGIGK